MVDVDLEAVKAGVAAARARRESPSPRLELVGEPAPSARIAEALEAFI